MIDTRWSNLDEEAKIRIGTTRKMELDLEFHLIMQYVDNSKIEELLRAISMNVLEAIRENGGGENTYDTSWEIAKSTASSTMKTHNIMIQNHIANFAYMLFSIWEEIDGAFGKSKLQPPVTNLESQRVDEKAEELEAFMDHADDMRKYNNLAKPLWDLKINPQ